jgi:hypothetical protein
MTRLITLSFFVLCLGLNAACAAGSDAPCEQLKALEWQIGDWVGEYTAPFDLGEIKAGDHVTSHTSFRWGLGRSLLIMDVHQVVSGRAIPDTHEVTYWDAGRERLMLTIFTPSGVGSGEFREVGDVTVLPWFVELDEGKLTGTSYIEQKDADTYTWQARDLALDDRKLPDFPVITMNRKVGAAGGELWREFVSVATGMWDGAGELADDDPAQGLVKGDRFEYRLHVTSELDGQAVGGEGVFQVPARSHVQHVRLLGGWDPNAQQIRYSAYWSGGLVEEIVLTKREGTVFHGYHHACSPGVPAHRREILADFTDGRSATFSLVDGTVLSTWRNIAAAATGGEMPDEVRRHIDKHLIGDWATEYRQGDVVTHGESSVRWANGGSVVVSQFTSQEADGTTVHGALVSGWDAAEQAFVESTVTSKGEHWRIRWSHLSAESWEGLGAGKFGGRDWRSPTRIEWKPNGFRYEDVTEGEQFVMIGRRQASAIVQPEGDIAVPADVLKHFERLVGQWTVQGLSAGGEPVEAAITFRWLAGNKALMFDATFSIADLTTRGAGIFGWESGAQQVHTSEFWSGGGYAHRHYRIVSDQKWEGHQFAGIDHLGQPLTQQIVFEMAGPDELTLTTSERVIAGNPAAGETRLVFRRK